MSVNSTDRPDLVTASDVLACRHSLPFTWIDSRSGYRLIFGYTLGRNLSQEETDEILSKINGYGPHKFEETWASVERSETNFWRSQW